MWWLSILHVHNPLLTCTYEQSMNYKTDIRYPNVSLILTLAEKAMIATIFTETPFKVLHRTRHVTEYLGNYYIHGDVMDEN